MGCQKWIHDILQCSEYTFSYVQLPMLKKGVEQDKEFVHIKFLFDLFVLQVISRLFFRTRDILSHKHEVNHHSLAFKKLSIKHHVNYSNCWL